jgi:hypothetical protein
MEGRNVAIEYRRTPERSWRSFAEAHFRRAVSRLARREQRREVLSSLEAAAQQIP